MKHFLDSKAIAFGFAISLITAVLSLTLAPVFFQENGTLTSYPEWDLNSPEKFALSMGEALPNLIYASILTGIVSTAFIENIQPWTVAPEPFFLSRIASFQYSPMLEDYLIGTLFKPDDSVFSRNNWVLNYQDCCSLDKQSILLTNVYDFQAMLQNGLNVDINKFNDLTNITFSLEEQVKIAEGQEDVFYWEIRHFYSDGTKIEIRAYGNIIIINQIQILEILYNEDGFSFRIDLNKIPFPSYYTVTLDKPFESYENVINDVLNTILDNNG